MLHKSKKRIAKNTLMLYFRMFLTMGVSLYTSRIVLIALGVTDYGVYNVVGGVVAMLGFFNSSIGTSTQRFLNVGMASAAETSLKRIFSTAVNVHILIGLITVILLETVGLWFVVNKLVIPTGQENAAFWVYQCSVFSFFISIISTPYNAAIIAYERMSAFAIFSIIEVLLKLCIAFAILHFAYNRLIFYAVLLLVSTIIMRILYGIYCSKTFKDIKYQWYLDPALIKKMMSFSGWMIFGCLADILGTQGVNMMINIFFGPVFNAARAIAVQVQAAVAQFSTNFIVSVNPQIVKSYASGDLGYSYRLVFTASKLSFFLMLILVVPIVLRSQEILSLWLKVVPDEAAIFVNIILIEYLIRSSYTPIAQINQASGNIRAYQLAIASLFFLNFAVTYVLFKCGYPVYSTFILSAFIALIGLFARLFILKIQLQFPAGKYLRDVTVRVCIVSISAFAVNYLINPLLANNILGLFYLITIATVLNIIFIWIIGLNKTEKLYISEKTNYIFQKLRRH